MGPSVSTHVVSCAQIVEADPLQTRHNTAGIERCSGISPRLAVTCSHKDMRLVHESNQYGPRIHYAERGDAQGKPIVFLHVGQTHGSRSAGSYRCYHCSFMHSYWTSVGSATRNVPKLPTESRSSPQMLSHFW